MPAKFWRLDVSAIPDSNDGGVKYTDHATAITLAKLVSAGNGNAPVYVVEAMEKIVGDTLTEI